MKSASQLVASGLVIALLTACGSSGSGSGATAPTPTPTPTPSPAASSSNASTSAGKYMFTTPAGVVYDITQPGFTAGKLNVLSGSTINGVKYDGKFSIGGSTYSYSRFGAFTSTDGTQKTTFYTGSATPVASVPTTGAVTFTGGAARPNGSYSTMSYSVDFGAKTFSASGVPEAATQFNPAFGDALSLSGTVSGSGFSGAATSGAANGTFAGSFYGPAATELGGQATFSDTNLSAGFGGKR